MEQRITPPSKFSLGFAELWRYRELFYFFTWRDVKVKYKQTFLGFAWAVLQPFLLMVVFSVFFGGALEVPSNGIPYPLFAFSGLKAAHPAVSNRIFVHGHKHSPSQIFAEMDVLINLSEFEAFGRVTMEAYSHGLPVIGLNSGATPELVREGITGFLINKNEEALRHACSTMLNKEQRRRMGREGFMFFNSFNDEEIFARKLEGIYRKAIRLDDRTS